MSFSIRSLPRRFRLVLCSIQQSDSLPFSDAVTQEQFQEICDEEGVSPEDDEVFTPWAFLSQVMHTALPLANRIGIDQPHIGLMHQCSGRKRMIDTLIAHLPRSDSLQFSIDHRKQIARGLNLPILNAFQNECDVRHRKPV